MKFRILIVFALFFVVKVGIAQDSIDLRNVNLGDVIYKNSYIDQPYVLQLPDDSWLCVFTTGAESESRPGQHIVAIKSFDHGKTWSNPVKIEQNTGPISSWAIPYRTSHGRIYVFYNYNGDNVSTVRGKSIKQAGLLGWYCYKYSDDNGNTWSNQRYRIPIRVTAADIYNEFYGKVQMFWGIDKPHYFNGAVYFAFSKLGEFPQGKGEGWLLKSDNLDTESDPSKVNWEMLPDGEYGIRNADFYSVQEEHNTVVLEDGSIYCVFRTALGFLGYTVSRDNGESWTHPDTLRYAADAPNIIKNPRACPRLFKCSNGKYLLWYHNHGGKDFKERSPVWIAGGVEKNGTIEWMQPEILLYTHDTDVNGMSYPDLIEKDGNFWITETQKKTARTHMIDPSLLEGLWRQPDNNTLTSKGLIWSKSNIRKKMSVRLPRLPLISDNGMTIEMKVKFESLAPGQVLLDSRSENNQGIYIATAENNALQITLIDNAGNSYSWITDKNMLTIQKEHYISIVVDGKAHVLSTVIDGRLCDGGKDRQYGWGKYSHSLGNINSPGKLHILSQCDASIKTLRIYGRYLRTSECIANYRFLSNK